MPRKFAADPGQGSDDPERPGPDIAAAKDLCLRLLTVRDRSRAELAERLRRRDVSEEVAAQVLDRLAEVGLINDAEFAASFVKYQRRERALGRAGLLRELHRKGIDPAIAHDVVANIDDGDERAQAAELVAKKLDSALFAGSDAARRRLLGQLARRGYSASIAIDVVNEALRGFAEPLEDPGEALS